MSKVYCEECNHVRYGEITSCKHPDNLIYGDSYSRHRLKHRWWPNDKNKNNDCELFEPITPPVKKANKWLKCFS